MKKNFLRRLWPMIFSVTLFIDHELAAQRLDRIISTQTRLIRHEATEYQRKVAEARARAYVDSQRRKSAAQTASKKGKEPEGEKSTYSKRLVPVRKKLSRYIAVETVKDGRANPILNKAVMLWDTHAEKLVGNNVYDLRNPPPLGKSARFDTCAAQYIGTGI